MNCGDQMNEKNSNMKAGPLVVEFRCHVTKFVQFKLQYRRYQNRRIVGQKWKLHRISKIRFGGKSPSLFNPNPSKQILEQENRWTKVETAHDSKIIDLRWVVLTSHLTWLIKFECRSDSTGNGSGLRSIVGLTASLILLNSYESKSVDS